MRLIAHRGARSRAPENTLTSYRQAQSDPVQYVEGDVALSSDNVPMMIHQETLQPDNAGKKLVLAKRDVGRAWLSAARYSDLRQIDAGSWFDAAYAAERIPSLQQVLELEWRSPALLLDLIDPCYWHDESDRSVCELFRTHVLPLVRRAVEEGQAVNVLAFNPLMLEVWQSELPKVDRTLALWTNYRGREREILQRALELQVSTVTIADFMLRDHPVWEAEIRRAGLLLGVYELTPDSAHGFGDWTPAQRKPMWDLVVKKRVDVFTCDYPVEFAEYAQLGSS